jgi:hypothetical protein
MLVAYHGQLDAVRTLAAVGAAVGASDTPGRTAGRLALERGHESAAKFLRRAAAGG